MRDSVCSGVMEPIADIGDKQSSAVHSERVLNNQIEAGKV